MIAVMTATHRCAKCGEELDGYTAAERHVDDVHGGAGRIEGLLGQGGRTGRESGTQAAGDAGGEGRAEGDASLPIESASDDGRSIYRVPEELFNRKAPAAKKRGRNRHAAGRVIPPPVNLPKLTDEERAAAMAAIPEVRRVIEEAHHHPEGETT